MRVGAYLLDTLLYIYVLVYEHLTTAVGSVQFSHSVMSDSLRPHESQHARPPCPSPTLGVHSNSRPSGRWCHPAISSSVVSSSSCPQSLPASGSFPRSQLLAWGGQSIGVSVLASVLPMNTQDWSPLGWAGWISLQSKWLARVFSTTVQKHHIYHQMSFDKRVKATQCGKLSLQQIELGKLDIYMQKNDMRPLFNTTHKNYL